MEDDSHLLGNHVLQAKIESSTRFNSSLLGILTAAGQAINAPTAQDFVEGAGDDTIAGGPGNDVIYDGVGNDVLFGDTDPISSPSQDVFVFRNDGGDNRIEDFQDGSDLIDLRLLGVANLSQVTIDVEG